MALRIRAVHLLPAQGKYRRCGVDHTKEPVVYPDDRFTTEELKVLLHDPHLEAEIIADPDEEPDPAMPEPELEPVAEAEQEPAPPEPRKRAPGKRARHGKR